MGGEGLAVKSSGHRRLVLRKTIHIAVGLLAFSLALGPRFAIFLTASLSVFNLWLLPRLGKRHLWRDPDGAADAGIAAYPLVLLVLSLCFFHRLEVVAATWAILAFGDGMAAVLGSALGRRPLPWNRDKTWLGSLSHVFFGTIGAAVLLLWMEWINGGHVSTPCALFLLLAAGLAAGLSAAIESLPLGLDDNWTAPPLAALLLWGILASRDAWSEGDAWVASSSASLGGQAVIGGLVATVVSLIAYRLRWVDASGAVVGGALATVITACLYFPGLWVFGAFFVLGSLATRLGSTQKQALGIAQGAGGRRGARNALANAGVPAVLAVFAVTTAATGPLSVAFVAAFAAATADTLSSEIGQVWGGKPVMITSGRPMPRGTDGGITWVGSLAGLLGGGAVATLGWVVGLYGATAMFWVLLASIVGNLLDSWLGATLEGRGLLDNEAVNFTSTLVASLLAAGLSIL